MLYSRHEAAEQLSISPRMVDFFIGQKKINARRIGRRVLIPHGELVKFARADHYISDTDIAA
jgi:excisionase family DNA binding protein